MKRRGPRTKKHTKKGTKKLLMGRGLSPGRARDIREGFYIEREMQRREKKQHERIERKDSTTLSHRRPSVPDYVDPDRRKRAREMLVYIVMDAPAFSDCLDEIERRVWLFSFDEDNTQTAIAQRLGTTQSSISKMVNRAVRKLNVRYLELRDTNRLPVKIADWVRQWVAATDANVQNPSLQDAVRALRLRDRARKQGRPATTGDPELNNLSVRRG